MLACLISDPTSRPQKSPTAISQAKPGMPRRILPLTITPSYNALQRGIPDYSRQEFRTKALFSAWPSVQHNHEVVVLPETLGTDYTQDRVVFHRLCRCEKFLIPMRENFIDLPLN